jgi:hypothetical protein
MADLWGGSLTYMQDEDDNDETGLGSQELVIAAHDGGAGKYLSIETKRWAVNTVEELIETLRDAARRLGVAISLP